MVNNGIKGKYSMFDLMDVPKGLERAIECIR